MINLGTSFKKACAILLSGLIILTSCGTTALPTPPPASPGKTSGIKANWFWNPSWWASNGALAAEVIGTINERPWMFTSAKNLNINYNGGTQSSVFDWANASQQWDASIGLLSVNVPITTGNTVSSLTLSIRPTYNTWGAHTWTVENVNYLNLKIIQYAQSGTQVSPLSPAGGSTIPLSAEKTAVITRVGLNANNTFGKAVTEWRKTSNGTLSQIFITTGNASNQDLQNLLSTTVSPAGISKCYTNPTTGICTNPNESANPSAPTTPCGGGGGLVTSSIRALICESARPKPVFPVQPTLGVQCTRLQEVARVALNKWNEQERSAWATLVPILITCGAKSYQCVLAIGSLAFLYQKSRAAESEYRAANATFINTCG